jgi:selenoprotein W-related protein
VHGGFLDVKELKQLIRDKIAPGKNLGHSDKKSATINE